MKRKSNTAAHTTARVGEVIPGSSFPNLPLSAWVSLCEVSAQCPALSWLELHPVKVGAQLPQGFKCGFKSHSPLCHSFLEKPRDGGFKKACKIRPRISAISEILNNYWHSKSLKAHFPPLNFLNVCFTTSTSQMHLVAVTQLTYWVLVAPIVDPQKWPQSVIFIKDLSATLSVPCLPCIFSFSLQPVKADDRPPESGSAHVCCRGICWSFDSIVQNALRRLGCDLALSKQTLID